MCMYVYVCVRICVKKRVHVLDRGPRFWKSNEDETRIIQMIQEIATIIGIYK